MNRYRLQLLAAVAMTIGFFAVLGWAGDYDYAEQVILRMSQEQYDYVRDTLTRLRNGNRPSEREIARWWEEHHNEVRDRLP